MVGQGLFSLLLLCCIVIVALLGFLVLTDTFLGSPTGYKSSVTDLIEPLLGLGITEFVASEKIQTRFLVGAVVDSMDRVVAINGRPMENMKLTVSPRVDLCAHPDPNVELTSNGQPLMAILIHSRATDFEGRQLIRDNWLLLGATNATIRLFMLGSASNSTAVKLIESEAKQWGDLVAGEFGESKWAMGTKTRLLVQWVRDHCTNAKYIVRWDGFDAPTDFGYLRHLLRQRVGQHMDDAILGYCYVGTQPLRSGVWNMPRETWPFSYYPRYPSGPMSVFTGKAIEQMSSALLTRPIDNFKFGDVAIGVLAMATGLNGCVRLPGIGGPRPAEILNTTQATWFSTHPMSNDESMLILQHWRSLFPVK